MAVLVLCVFLALLADHGAWCGQVHRVEWSVAGVAPYLNAPLEVELEDDVLFLCPNGSFSNVIYNTDKVQFDMCDASASNGRRFPVGECTGSINQVLSEEIQFLPVPLGGIISYDTNETFYFTSYSDGMSLISASTSLTRGGECLMGLKLAILVVNNTDTTTVPNSNSPEPTTVPSESMVIQPPEGADGRTSDSPLSMGVIIGIGAGGGVIIIVVVVCCIVCICLCCCKKKRGKKTFPHGERVTPDGAVSDTKPSDIEKGHASITSIKVELIGNEEVKRVSVKEAKKNKDRGTTVTNGVGKQPQEYDTPKTGQGSKVNGYDVPSKKGPDSKAKPNGVSKTPLKPVKVQPAGTKPATTEDKKPNRPAPGVKPAQTSTTKPSTYEDKPLPPRKPSGTRTPGEGTDSSAPKKPQVSVQVGAGRATFSTAQNRRPSGPARSTGDPTKPPSGVKKPSISQETTGDLKSPTERLKPSRPAPVAKPPKTSVPLRQDSEPSKPTSPPPDYQSVVNPVQSLPVSSGGRRLPPPPPGRLPPLNKP